MKKIILAVIFLITTTFVFGQRVDTPVNNTNKQSPFISNTQKAPTNSDLENPPKDQLVSDDMIIQGDLQIGDSATNNYNFGYKTLVMSAFTPSIYFDDRNITGGTYGYYDWLLEANSPYYTGANYFGIKNVTNSTYPFSVMGDAPSYSLFVSNNGNIGINTYNPILKLHIKDGDTPGIRLEQDDSDNYPAQTWDIAANDANFFVRDETNSNLLPFRIIPNTPTNTLYLNHNGVGIGTTNPQEKLHVKGNIMSDSSLILGKQQAPASPVLGQIYTDSQDSTLKFFNGNTWTGMLNTDNQNLVSATLVGTVLGIEIENGDSVNVDLYPLIQDLENRVAALEAQVGIKNVELASARLYQNYPNPFINQTTIPLYIPESTNDARLVIYDLKGKVIKSVVLNQRGRTSYVLNDKNLAIGTYFYTLKLDNKELESKILIKVEK